MPHLSRSARLLVCLPRIIAMLRSLRMLALVLAATSFTSTIAIALPPTYSNGGSGWDQGTLAFGTRWSSARDAKLRGPQLQALNAQLTLKKSRQNLNNPVAPGGGAGLNGPNQQGRAGFNLQIPLTALPGRGMDLALNLYYNSQLWFGSPEDNFNFDVANDWPVPGFLVR